MWFFFFSSRRRHTRWTGDWSSDVCSSDLDRLAGADDLLLVLKGGRCVLVAEDIEVGLPGQLLRGTARGVRGDPADADEEEPAQQVLEVHPLLSGGQQVAHADELELAHWIAAWPLRWLRLGVGHHSPPEEFAASAPTNCPRHDEFERSRPASPRITRRRPG